MVKDTGSPPFSVNGNSNIGRDSHDVKGNAGGRPHAFEAVIGGFPAISGEVTGPAHNG